MPILHIRALPQADPSKIEPALKETCLAISDTYGCEVNQVWATWEEIKPSYYVEGEQSQLQQPLNTHPPIGELTCFEGKDPQTIEKVLLAAANTCSKALGISKNIFITYREAKSGQVIAGNGIVKK